MSAHHGLPALEALYNAYQRCDRCSLLCRSRRNVVFGSGSATAPLMVVGEAPGEVEDDEGLPFVGPSGRLLMELLRMAWPETPEMEAIAGIQPDEKAEDPHRVYFDELRAYLDQHVFFTNAALCRPPENRAPTHGELKACSERLHRTIYAVDPLLIFALGKTAVSALLGRSTKVTEKRGAILDVAFPSPDGGHEVRYPVMALLHPAYLLRKGDKDLVTKEQGETWTTLQDMRDGIALLDAEYHDIHGTSFPHRPEGWSP